MEGQCRTGRKVVRQGIVERVGAAQGKTRQGEEGHGQSG